MPRLIRFTVSCACIRAQGHTLVRNPGVESGFPDQISYHVTLVPTKKRLMPQVPYHDTSNRLWISIFCVNVHISPIGLNKAMKRRIQSKGKLTNLSIEVWNHRSENQGMHHGRLLSKLQVATWENTIAGLGTIPKVRLSSLTTERLSRSHSCRRRL